MKLACGIDIGGSGVKGALVDLTTGTYSGESVLIKTPSPATPDAVAQVCGQVLETLGVTPEIPVGITFPAPIVHGRVPFMANLDPSWAGIDVVELMDRHLGRTIVALNDADAAGLGEAIYGAARGVPGVVIVARRSSMTGSFCPTPSSATSRSMATMPRLRLRQAKKQYRTLIGSRGLVVFSAITRTLRCSSPPISLSSVAA